MNWPFRNLLSRVRRRGNHFEGILELFDDHVHVGEVTVDGRYVPRFSGPTLERWVDANRAHAAPDKRLAGLTLINAFFENSTRTLFSFEVAGKRLGAQVANFHAIGSSVQKGESLIDTALTTIKTNADPAARKTAAEAIDKEFGAQVWNIWLTHTCAGIITRPYVNGIKDKLPDGSTGIGVCGAGRQQVNEVWCNNGKCE